MISLLPTSYFGSIAYFRELAKHDTVQIEAREYFPKQTFRNRCDVLAANGILSLSIPVQRPHGSRTPVNEVLIVEESWRSVHWKSIRSAYEAAPYFDHYSSEIKELIYLKENKLVDFNLIILKRILEWLDLNVEIDVTNEFKPYQPNDLRTELVSKKFQDDFMPAPYIQTFPGTQSFKMNLSILDAILCEGPLARHLILSKE